MVTLRDRETAHLFDTWTYLGEKRRKLLETSRSAVLRRDLLPNIDVERFAPYFDADLRRPTKDLRAGLDALILEQIPVR